MTVLKIVAGANSHVALMLNRAAGHCKKSHHPGPFVGDLGLVELELYFRSNAVTSSAVPDGRRGVRSPSETSIK